MSSTGKAQACTLLSVTVCSPAKENTEESSHCQAAGVFLKSHRQSGLISVIITRGLYITSVFHFSDYPHAT